MTDKATPREVGLSEGVRPRAPQAKPDAEPVGADTLRRLLPHIKKALSSCIFTADVAGEVAADLNALEALAHAAPLRPPLTEEQLDKLIEAHIRRVKLANAEYGAVEITGRHINQTDY